jgi:hypothetical protein
MPPVRSILLLTARIALPHLLDCSKSQVVEPRRFLT